MPRLNGGVEAVVLDLFGTLVAAPRTADRLRAPAHGYRCVDAVRHHSGVLRVKWRPLTSVSSPQ
jgi:hypothetical protein